MKGASNITAPPFVGGTSFSSAIAGLGSETGAVADGDTLLASLAKINDRVGKSGNETIAGEKTFSSDVHCSSGYISGSDPDNKIYFFGTGFALYDQAGTYIGRYDNDCGLIFKDTLGICWTNGSPGGTVDTGVERQSAGVIVPRTDNTHDLGSATKRFDDIYATNTTIQSSARELKEDIKPCPLGLNFINSLNPVVYRWAEQIFQDEIRENGNITIQERVKPAGTRYHAGLIADEVADALDAAGVERDKVAAYINPAATGDDGHEGLRYVELFAPLLKAVQELSAKVTALESAP